MVRGAPGSGKTILGNQICFANAKRGAHTAFVTLLSESHARMMLHLESLSFFDPELVDARVQYISGFGALESDGLRGVLDLLRHELRSKRHSVIVIDGLVSLSETKTSPLDLKRFFQELQLHADLAGCTILMLTGMDAKGGHAANTMVDGVFELSDESYELRAFREFRVVKFRGSAHLRGGHFFKITGEGVSIFPRVEALHAEPATEDKCIDGRAPIGVASLDALLGGGLPAGTTTMLTGPSGSGKTTLGMHFRAATPPKQKALFFGFYETPQRFLFKANKLQLPLESMARRGSLELVWQPSTEQNIDELAQRLLTRVERTGVTRLFIDGLDGFQRATFHVERVHHIFTALANELRARNVTTIYTYEVPKFLGPDLEAPITGVSALVENLLYLRFVELRSRLYRVLSILKVRNVEYDSKRRIFNLGATGFELDARIDGAEEVFAGLHLEAPNARPKTRRKKR